MAEQGPLDTMRLLQDSTEWSSCLGIFAGYIWEIFNIASPLRRNEPFAFDRTDTCIEEPLMETDIPVLRASNQGNQCTGSGCIENRENRLFTVICNLCIDSEIVECFAFLSSGSILSDTFSKVIAVVVQIPVW
jgi:hypothetical protein